MVDQLTENELLLCTRFAKNFQFYAEQCLKIRPKTGPQTALRFNRSQRAIHDKCEDMLKRRGRVRLIALKSRQVGISTYFAARGYYKTCHNEGFRAFVLTQMDDTTDALFGMIKRFHDNVPDFVRPITGASNAKELVFSRLDSGYRVSTAGNKATGLGHTLQIFHGSEVSRWPNAMEHVGGVMQAIPDVPKSEVYLESTAFGVGNIFHTKCKEAMAGKGEFEFIFLPWFWHEEYTKPVPPELDFKPPSELTEYAELHGLTKEQTYWAYIKNMELAAATTGRSEELCWLFRQEYPATAQEAFQTSGVNSFVSGDLVMRARKGKAQGFGPIIIGVDVARGGGDKSAIIDRQGRRMGGHICKKFDYGKDVMPLVGDIVRLVKEMRTADLPLKKIIVDATGVGGPVYDQLRDQLGVQLVEGVEFGGRALQKERYANRRAEIWDTMRQWLMNDAGVSVPDDDDFQGDLCAPSWGEGATRFRTDGSLLIEDKDHMKKRLKFSPDYGDAAALTFAINYAEHGAMNQDWRPAVTGEGAWML
jgi:hypothetical protein